MKERANNMYDRPGQEEHNSVPFKGSCKDPQRHNEFQRGQNPMQQTPFEASLTMKEALDRHMAKVKYVQGIQGVDGGHFHESY